MAGLCGNLCRSPLLAAGADRPHQRQEPAYRLALEIAGHGDQAGQSNGCLGGLLRAFGGESSCPAEADADHVKLKTEMLQLRLMEKKREFLPPIKKRLIWAK